MRSILLVCLITGTSSAADGEKDPLAPGVRESQVTLTTVHGNKVTQVQATVIGKRDRIVTVMTAAHGIAPSDVGGMIRMRRGDKMALGRVESVARNPNYRPQPSTDIPGADNAIATILFDTRGTLPLASLEVAEVAAWAIPEPTGRTLSVEMQDQFGKEHIVKAGNYTNPRWLEWGPIYRPVPGDSGSGVFVVRLKRDGSTGPVLVGVVVDRSDRGGGASLIHRDDPWVADATKPPVAQR